jgi:hypothetical protein
MQSNLEKHWELLREQGVRQIGPTELKQIKCVARAGMLG